MKQYYFISFFICLTFHAAEQLIIFNPYTVKQYTVNGIATFLDTITIDKGDITINGNCSINNNKFFNVNKNTFNIYSNNITIEGLMVANIGYNYLAIDENNNLSILQNTLLLETPLATNYNITYTSNIIGKEEMPLKIGNNSLNEFCIGNFLQKTSNIIFNSNQTIINSIDTIDNRAVIISQPFISSNDLQVDSDILAEGNVLADSIHINNDLTITDPIYFSNMTINDNCIINNNNELITIVPKNGILQIKKNIVIKGLPLYNNIQNKFTLFALDNNKNIYKFPLPDANTIDAINEDLFFIAENSIYLGSDSSTFIELTANRILLDTININSNNLQIEFNFPVIFKLINPNTLSQLIFKDTLSINNLFTINNLFSATNNNSIARINQTNHQKTTTFNSDQMIFLNYNTMDIYQGQRLVIDQNNQIGIEGLNNKNNIYLRIHNDIRKKINIIEQRIRRINKNIDIIEKIASYILAKQKEQKLFHNYIISEINNFL
jgi:hypothetical protein